MKTELKYGLIIGIFLFIWLLLEYILGIHAKYISYHNKFTIVSYIIPLLGLYFGIKNKRIDSGTNKFQFGEAFSSGLIMCFVFIVFTLLSYYLYYSLINPGFFNLKIQQALDASIDLGIDYSQAKMDSKKYFSTINYLFTTASSYLFAGIFFTSFLAIFLRKKNNNSNQSA